MTIDVVKRYAELCNSEEWHPTDRNAALLALAREIRREAWEEAAKTLESYDPTRKHSITLYAAAAIRQLGASAFIGRHRRRHPLP